MGMELWHIQVDLNMKDNGKKVKSMEEEYITMKMGWFLKVVLLLEGSMEMVFLFFPVVQKL